MQIDLCHCGQREELSSLGAKGRTGVQQATRRPDAPSDSSCRQCPHTDGRSKAAPSRGSGKAKCMSRPRRNEAGPEECPGSCIKLPWEPSPCPHVQTEPRDKLPSADLLWQRPRGGQSDARVFGQLLGLSTAEKSTGKPRWTAPRPPVAALAPDLHRKSTGSWGQEARQSGSRQEWRTESVRGPMGSVCSRSGRGSLPPPQAVCGGPSPKQDDFIMTEHEIIHVKSASPPPQAPHVRTIGNQTLGAQTQVWVQVPAFPRTRHVFWMEASGTRVPHLENGETTGLSPGTL